MTELSKDDKAFCQMLSQYLALYDSGETNVIDDIVECAAHLLDILSGKGFLN